ncbi:MAG: hypothetical protein SGJ23_15345 [Alphaproteobacteria bacterium]|nr:hypothetical protein [Alphaproteobacteria bacterium]
MTALKRITLRLARNPDAGYPDGDQHHGYTIVAPLHDDGRLDVETWRAAREKCTVIRFSPDADQRADGWLTHRGSHWSIRYDEIEEGPDEPLFRLSEHKLVVAEYLSVADPDGPTLVYRVADVSPVTT